MTSADLYRLFGLELLAALTNPPGPAIGGCVFIIRHRWFWSVNHVSKSGTGWQSEKIHNRELAGRAADVLARFTGAELVR